MVERKNYFYLPRYTTVLTVYGTRIYYPTYMHTPKDLSNKLKYLLIFVLRFK